MAKSNLLKAVFNPFVWIAGYKALGWGVAGIAVSCLLGYLTGTHYHGLLHFGPAPNNLWWCYAAERLIVWLLPSVLFYLGGICFSKSRIRPVDVFGTVAFSQLLFIPMTLFFFFPQVKVFEKVAMNPLELTSSPQAMIGLWLMLVSSVFAIWSVVWMFNALKISTNLKGKYLAIVYILAVFGGDAACRYLIEMLYKYN